MSWDLNQDELRDKFNALPTTQTPDVGLGHNFVEGAGKMAMKIAAESARAVQFAGAVVPIYQDWMTDKRKTQGIGQESAVKTVTAQERYFKSMADGPLQSAVDFWTPKPFEVGTAGEVVGSLLGMLPLIMAGPAGPSMAVGATMMSQGQNLVDQGAPAGKAAAVATVQGLGLGLGIMAPILGRTLLERVLVGGAGFNVVQGAVTRGVSGAILEGEKAAENFHAFSGKDMFIDALAGSMFGVGAHLIPAQRAQGEAAWKAISEFLGEATPTQKAAAATLLDHLHITTESLPGAPVTPADREVHIQRMAQAINDLANDRPVDVENIVRDVSRETPTIDAAHAAVEELNALNPQLNGALRVEVLSDAEMASRPVNEEAGLVGEVMAGHNGSTINLRSGSKLHAVMEEVRHMIDMLLGGNAHSKWLDADADLKQRAVEFLAERRAAGDLAPNARMTDAREIMQALLDQFFRNPQKLEQALPEMYRALMANGADKYAPILDKLQKAQDRPDAMPAYTPDMARIEQDQAIREAIQEHAKTVAAEEGIPQIPDRKTIAQTIEEQLVQAGRPAEEAKAGATLWQAFFDTTASRYGRTGQEIFDRYMKGITGQAGEGPMLAQPDKLFQGAVPWYHSELERQIGTAKMGAASPKDWKNYIKGLSNKGVKADEVKWTGLEEWLDLQQGKVTKEQIQQYMKDGGVKVEETVLAEKSQETADIEAELARTYADAREAQRDFWELAGDTSPLDRANIPWWAKEAANGDTEGMRKLRNLFDDDQYKAAVKWGELENEHNNLSAKIAAQKTNEQTKFATYQLPGGENYRELLLTLPENGKPATLPEGYSLQEMARGDYTLVGPDGSGSILSGTLGASESYRTNAAIEMLRRKGVLPPEPTPFRSSHFDQPNILSHIRFNERTDDDGKKVLFIEEIQSDWAQKGKKEGFRVTPEREAELRAKIAEIEKIGRDATPEQKQQWADAMTELQPETMQGKAPQAPFVGKTEAWVGLSLKRMIRYAAENGFDRVAWTNGEQQAARYDLSKQVDRVVASRGGEDGYDVVVYSKENPNRPFFDENVTAEKLPDVVGKDLAERIVKEATYEKENEYSGLDLKVGGEGMKAFYDKIVPNVANDVLKKLGGGRVGEVKIDMIARAKNGGMEMGDHLDRQENPDFKVQPQPGFDITPSMREKAMETQALFQPERGALQFDQQGKMAIALLKSADPSTFLHESGHFFLEVTNDLASQPDAPAGMKQDMQTLYSWFGLKDADTWNNMTLDEKRPYHEQFARGFERYLRDGQAPTPVLKGLFQRFRDWLKAVYQSASQLNVEVSDQVRAVMDRMLAEPQRTEAPPEATRSATPPPPRGGVGEPMGEASVLTEVQQVREDIMAAEHTARQRWGDAIIDALYEKYAPHLEDAGQLRGMSAIMESLAEDAKPAYLMKTMGPRPKEPQSLIAAIKELGGINTSMRSDIAGPDKKGVPVSLFRKAGKNVDELALLLQEKGFLNEADIANESDNGGINKLMEMIQDEIGGNKHYSERDATQAAALREHDQFMESIDGKGESASTHFTPEEWATIQREVIAEGMAPTAKNVVDADAVSIAMQIDEARVERAAITAADDFDFMAEVREIIDGYKPQPDATAAERGTPTAAEPGTPGPAGQEANAPGADRNAGNQGVIAQQALRMVAENPDLPIATGVDAQGNTTYQKASEYLAEAKAMAELKRQDVSLFELAAQCLLGGGR